MVLKTKREMLIWNEAIKAAAKDLLKWDGVFPEEKDRKYVSEGIIQYCSRKKLSVTKDK